MLRCHVASPFEMIWMSGSLDQNGGVASENADRAGAVQLQHAEVVHAGDVGEVLHGHRAVVFDSATPVAGEIAGDRAGTEDRRAGVEDSAALVLGVVAGAGS